MALSQRHPNVLASGVKMSERLKSVSCKRTSRKTKPMALGRRTRRSVQMSGFSREEKRPLTDMIVELGGNFYSEQAFDVRCNLVVIKRPCRSEKYLCALATGIPIVKVSYVTESYRAGCWLGVTEYVWNSRPDDADFPEDLVVAPLRAIARVRESKRKAFSKWICGIKVDDQPSAAVYKRILKAGGAQVVDINLESVTNTRNIPAGLTHLFTENCFQGPGLQTVAKNSIHCIIADYIGDFLIKDEQCPQPHHYIVPHCPVVDLTDSPDCGERRTILSETDSDIEIISMSAGPNQASKSTTPTRPLRYIPLPTSPLATGRQASTANTKSMPATSKSIHLTAATSLLVTPKTDHKTAKRQLDLVKRISEDIPLRRVDEQQKGGDAESPYQLISTYGILSNNEGPAVISDKHISQPDRSQTHFPKSHSQDRSQTQSLKSHSQDTFQSHFPNSQSHDRTHTHSPNSHSQISLSSQSFSQVRTATEASQSPKKYTKILSLTPGKSSVQSQQSQQSQATRHFADPSIHVALITSQVNTPVKIEPSKVSTPVKVEPYTTPSQSLLSAQRCPPRQSPSTSQRRSRKKPVMPSGSLLKYLTVNSSEASKKSTSPATVGSKYVGNLVNGENHVLNNSLFDGVLPLDNSLNGEHIDEEAANDKDDVSNGVVKDSFSNISGLIVSRELEDFSCLGLLDGYTRLTTEERTQLYSRHEHLTAIHAKKAEEKIDLTDEFHSKELQAIPVLLLKQIETYFDCGKFSEETMMNGVEMLDSCTSELFYPPPRLLKHLYSFLLKTVNPTNAYAIYEYLMNKLLIHPPNRRIYEDESASPSKHYRTRRMRHIYKISLIDDEHFKSTYLKNLNTAVQTIIGGGLPLVAEARSLRQNSVIDEEDDLDDKDFGLSPTHSHVRSSLSPAPVDSDGAGDGRLGSRLYIEFLTKLLSDDYHTAKTYKESILHDLCKGFSFSVNLVDSKDTKSLLDLMELLLHNKETESGLKLVKLVGLLAEMCKPDDMAAPTSHALTVLISRLSDIINNSDSEMNEAILNCGVIPYWLAFKVLIHILQDESAYNAQLVVDRTPLTTLSLRHMISNYFFLVPNESVIISGSPHSENDSAPSGHVATKVKRNFKGETPLHVSCIKNDVERVRQLLCDSDMDVNAVDNAGWTPLHEACNHQNLAIVELLLSHKSPHFHADGRGLVNMLAAGGDDSITPLHDAVIVEAIEVVKLLLKYGGGKLVTAKSRLGTPLDIVTNPEIERLLREALQSAEQAREGVDDKNKPGGRLRILHPDPQIYRNQTCSIGKLSIDRYVAHCLDALSLYLAAFPLTLEDRHILDKLSSHIQPFIDHVTWLNSNSEELPQVLYDKLVVLSMVSL